MFSLSQWLDTRRKQCQMSCSVVPLETLDRWSLKNGRIVHDTGGFFSIVGGYVSPKTGNGMFSFGQPLIDQPKVGILGCLLGVNEGSVPQILVQAKAEPGNVGIVQLGPSVQSTVCNYSRLHGGLPTPYLDYFTEGKESYISDSLQSEQGTRFYGKYNRNVVCEVTSPLPDSVSDDWKWFDFSELQQLFDCDYALNTDLRSCLVCADWSNLCGGGIPFDGVDEGVFRQSLRHSWMSSSGADSVDGLLVELEKQRKENQFSCSLISLNDLTDWRWEMGRIEGEIDRSFAVIGCHVEADSREVPSWDQPLVQSISQDRIELICQKRSGILHFLIRARAEIGFKECVQYGPTLQSGDLDDMGMRESSDWEATLSELSSIERVGCLQSDEGGRFYRSSTYYAVCEVSDNVEFPPVESSSFRWATLGQIYLLLRQKGVFSNEMRSALSLLLKFV